MTNSEIAYALKEAFEDGYHNYASPCSAYNTCASAWDESETKPLYDRLLIAAG